MAGATLTIDDAEVSGALDGLLAALGDLTPVFKNIGEHVQATTIDRFAEQKSPEGVPWKPLLPIYAATKKGPGILRETGQMAQIVYQVAEDMLQVGTNAIYAAVHQFGATIRPKEKKALAFMLGGQQVIVSKVEIPARPFLGLTADDQLEISGLVEDYLDASSGGALQFT